MVDALDVAAVRSALRAAAANTDKLSVVICQSPCIVEYRIRGNARAVDPKQCTGCGTCTRIGCPAISKDADGKACIDPSLCNGCPQCAQYCMFDAIHEEA